MTDRFPLIIDTVDNRIKELPSEDNLDLQGCGIINANSITAGTITVNSISINNQTLAPVAFSNDYNDLDNTPTGFTGSYNDLSNLPFIPTTTRALSDVVNEEAEDGQALLYNSLTGEYEPGNVITELDLSEFDLGDIGNVITLGLVDERFLKFTAGAWRPSRVQWSEIQNKPVALSQFNNDLDYTEIVGTTLQNNGLPALATQTIDISGSVFADDSSLIVDAVNGTIPGYLSVEEFKNIVAASTDFADFQTRVDNL